MWSELKPKVVLATIIDLERSNKRCAAEPIPTRLLKDCADVLAPFLTEKFNRSLSVGVFPMQFKAAFITPLLKKSDLVLWMSAYTTVSCLFAVA